MRLIVTRPMPDAENTAAALRARGHEAIVAPLLDIAFASPPKDAGDPAAIFVTSRNGVRALNQWPQAVAWRDKPVFATGAATARALASAGFRTVIAAGGDGAALGRTIIEEMAAGDGPLIYPAPRDRSGALPESLIAAGYTVRVIEAYRAEPVAHLPPAAAAALGTGRADGVLLYSRRTAATFRDRVAEAGLSAAIAPLRYFVISEAVASVVRPFAADVRVAAAPDEDSLLALVSA
jgi:uroporphyrinogen-III synthase